MAAKNRHLAPLLVGLLAMTLPAAVRADLPQPSYGSAVVDGDYGEWDLGTDFVANLYRAGDPSKPLEARLYMRYDCTTGTMYALVLDAAGVIGILDPAAQTSWISLDQLNHKVVTENSGNDGVPPDFAWVGRGFDGNPCHVQGYEASFNCTAGTHAFIVHTSVFDVAVQTAATQGFPKGGFMLLIDCQTPVHRTTWGALKHLFAR